VKDLLSTGSLFITSLRSQATPRILKKYNRYCSNGYDHVFCCVYLTLSSFLSRAQEAKTFQIRSGMERIMHVKCF